MKRKVLLLLCIGIMSLSSWSQDAAFNKGDKLLNVGIGVNSYYSGGIPIGASFEIGINDQFSVGPNIDFLSTKYGGAGSSFKFTALYIGARASWHANEALNISNPKIDLYLGPTIGYRVFSWKDDYNGSTLKDSYGSGIYIGGFLGGKYYFNEKLGGFVELGAIGSTNARLGLAVKF